VSNPQQKPYNQTVFIVEGITLAVIVTSGGGKMTQRRKHFTSPQAALSWCRHHRAGMVYSPSAETLSAN
jgi:hypothetical protein